MVRVVVHTIDITEVMSKEKSGSGKVVGLRMSDTHTGAIWAMPIPRYQQTVLSSWLRVCTRTSLPSAPNMSATDLHKPALTSAVIAQLELILVTQDFGHWSMSAD